MNVAMGNNEIKGESWISDLKEEGQWGDIHFDI
jgi:hypothetical protein